MNYPIIICEDNLVQLQQLNTILENYILFHSDQMEVTLKTQCPQEVKDYIIKFEPKNGIYFLDIDLKHKMNGIDLAEWIRKYDIAAKIVFVTTHDELAPLTLKRKVEALGFIAKDQAFEKYRSEVMDLLALAQKRIDAAKRTRKAIFTFSVGTQMYNIDLDEVLFIVPSQMPHRVVLHTIYGQYEFYGRLNELEEKYTNLFRVSRGCLANLINVSEVDFSKRVLIFEEGVTKTFSAGKSKKIRDFINNCHNP